MTDPEAMLRDGLQIYAAETTASISPPPFAFVLAAAESPTRSRRRARVAAAAAAVVVMTGMAAAAGVLPGPVSEMLREMRVWGFDVSEDEARRVASAASGDTSFELWNAQGPGGDECIYVRVVHGGVDVNRGGASMCFYDRASDPARFLIVQAVGLVDPYVPWSGTYPPTIAGRLPLGATRLEVVLSDGTTYHVNPEGGGWFLTVLPMDHPEGTRVRWLRATDPEGATVGVIRGGDGRLFRDGADLS